MKTTLYSILAAAVRMAALLFVARAVSGLVAYFASADAVLGPQRWAMAIGSAASIGIGLMLWLFPGILVRPATGRSAHEVFESALSANDILRIGIALMGVWFAVSGISELTYAFLRVAVLANTGQFTGDPFEFVRAEIWANVFAVVLGIALALGSRGLVGLLGRLRDGR